LCAANPGASASIRDMMVRTASFIVGPLVATVAMILHSFRICNHGASFYPTFLVSVELSMQQNVYQWKIGRLFRDAVRGGLWRLRDGREAPAAIA
jgi:hypothetical protein